MFVYLITNKINNKKYVGQHVGKDLHKYLNRNIQLAILGYNNQRPLYRAFLKYGRENFQIEPLLVVGTKEDLDYYESRLIVLLNTKIPSGYNSTDGGDGALGLSRSILDKRNKKISNSLKGNKNCLGRKESEETRRKKSEINKGNRNALGAVRSPEYCKQKSESQKGRKFSENTIRKMSEAAHRRKDSDETKRKKSENAKRLGLRPPKHTTPELARAGLISCHKRYHIKRNVVNSQCKLCQEVQNGLVNKPRVQRDQEGPL